MHTNGIPILVVVLMIIVVAAATGFVGYEIGTSRGKPVDRVKISTQRDTIADINKQLQESKLERDTLKVLNYTQAKALKLAQKAIDDLMQALEYHKVAGCVFKDK